HFSIAQHDLAGAKTFIKETLENENIIPNPNDFSFPDQIYAISAIGKNGYDLETIDEKNKQNYAFLHTPNGDQNLAYCIQKDLLNHLDENAYHTLFPNTQNKQFHYTQLDELMNITLSEHQPSQEPSINPQDKGAAPKLPLYSASSAPSNDKKQDITVKASPEISYQDINGKALKCNFTDNEPDNKLKFHAYKKENGQYEIIPVDKSDRERKSDGDNDAYNKLLAKENSTEGYLDITPLMSIPKFRNFFLTATPNGHALTQEINLEETIERYNSENPDNKIHKPTDRQYVNPYLRKDGNELTVNRTYPKDKQGFEEFLSSFSKNLKIKNISYASSLSSFTHNNATYHVHRTKEGTCQFQSNSADPKAFADFMLEVKKTQQNNYKRDIRERLTRLTDKQKDQLDKCPTEETKWETFRQIAKEDNTNSPSPQPTKVKLRLAYLNTKEEYKEIFDKFNKAGIRVEFDDSSIKQHFRNEYQSDYFLVGKSKEAQTAKMREKEYRDYIDQCIKNQKPLDNTLTEAMQDPNIFQKQQNVIQVQNSQSQNATV
ncbi:hypothetical protein, partial [Fangia hongkongensis]